MHTHTHTHLLLPALLTSAALLEPLHACLECISAKTLSHEMEVTLRQLCSWKGANKTRVIGISFMQCASCWLPSTSEVAYVQRPIQATEDKSLGAGKLHRQPPIISSCHLP